MKGASSGIKKINQMLKQVQHDIMVQFLSFCHPELVSGSRFLGFKAPPCGRGSLL
jgi:hypothetical protein